MIPLSLPPLRHDLRIARLRKAFGRRPFTTAQAAAVLRLQINDVFSLFFAEPGLEDDTARVAMHHADWWLVSRNPEAALAEQTMGEHWPILRERDEWTAEEFAEAAGIPFPSANYLLSLMVRHGKIEMRAMHINVFVMPRRRKVTIRG
jgi:hypothetical protein